MTPPNCLWVVVDPDPACTEEGGVLAWYLTKDEAEDEREKQNAILGYGAKCIVVAYAIVGSEFGELAARVEILREAQRKRVEAERDFARANEAMLREALQIILRTSGDGDAMKIAATALGVPLDRTEA